MIKKLTYDEDKCLIDCDGVVIPSHGIREIYESEIARPFVYFEPNANYDNSENGIAIVGPYGSTHRNLVNQNMMLIKGKFQIKNDSDLLRGRLWEKIIDFGGIITFWDKAYVYPISSALISKLKNSLKESDGINIGKMWLSFLCEGCDYYFITVDDFIFGGYSDKMDLIPAFKKQQKLLNRGNNDKYKDWDYEDQDIGYLGYHLMTRQDENKTKKMIFTESDVKYIIKECIKKLYKHIK